MFEHLSIPLRLLRIANKLLFFLFLFFFLGRPDWVGTGRKGVTLASATQSYPDDVERAKEKEIMLRRRREMELRRKNAEAEELALKAAAAAEVAQSESSSWFSWWRR